MLKLVRPVAGKVLIGFHFRNIVDLKTSGRIGGLGAGSFIVVAVSVVDKVGVAATSFALSTIGDLTRFRRHGVGGGGEGVAKEDSHDVAVERRVIVFLERATGVFFREKYHVGRLEGIAVFVVVDVCAFEIPELLEQIVNVQIRHGRIQVGDEQSRPIQHLFLRRIGLGTLRTTFGRVHETGNFFVGSPVKGTRLSLLLKILLLRTLFVPILFAISVVSPSIFGIVSVGIVTVPSTI